MKWRPLSLIFGLWLLLVSSGCMPQGRLEIWLYPEGAWEGFLEVRFDGLTSMLPVDEVISWLTNWGLEEQFGVDLDDVLEQITAQFALYLRSQGIAVEEECESFPGWHRCILALEGNNYSLLEALPGFTVPQEQDNSHLVYQRLIDLEGVDIPFEICVHAARLQVGNTPYEGQAFCWPALNTVEVMVQPSPAPGEGMRALRHWWWFAQGEIIGLGRLVLGILIIPVFICLGCLFKAYTIDNYLS